MKSITRQLQIYLALTLSVGAFILFTLSYHLLDKTLRKSAIQDLHAESDALVATLIRQGEAIALASERAPSYFHHPYSGHYFIIQLGDQTWRSRSLWDFNFTINDAGKSDLLQGPRQQKIISVKKIYRRFNQDINIWVGQDYAPVITRLNTIAWMAGIGFMLFLATLLAAQKIIIRRSFIPVYHLQNEIDALQRGKKHTIDTQFPIELQPLALEINRLLENTETTLQRSRSHLSNLGHALKTPLAVLVAQLQHPAIKQTPKLYDTLHEHLDQIERRVHRELSKARLAGDVLPSAYFSPASELPDLITTLKIIHNPSLNIEWQAASHWLLAIDREDALELIGNLLDNACKWAKQHVAIDFKEKDHQLLMRVSDDGPGISENNILLAQSRGKRLDESVQGHGLGLTIVNDICHHLNATIQFSTSRWGGLCVCIHFPPKLNASRA